MQDFDCQRLVVGQTDPLDLEDFFPLAQSQHARHFRRGRRPGDADQTRTWFHPSRPEVGRMARQLQQMVHLRPGHKGATALVTKDALLRLEVVEGLADGAPGHAEPFR